MNWIKALVLFIFISKINNTNAQFTKEERYSRYQILLHSLRCDCHKKYITPRSNYLLINEKMEQNNTAVFVGKKDSSSYVFIEIDTIPLTQFTTKNNKYYTKQQDEIIGLDSSLENVFIKKITLVLKNKSIIFPVAEYNYLGNIDLKSLQFFSDKKQKTFFIYINGGKEEKAYTLKYIFSAKQFITTILLKGDIVAADRLIDGD